MENVARWISMKLVELEVSKEKDVLICTSKIRCMWIDKVWRKSDGVQSMSSSSIFHREWKKGLNHLTHITEGKPQEDAKAECYSQFMSSQRILLFLEIRKSRQRIKNITSVDWQWLCIKFMELLKNKFMCWSRQGLE